MNQIAILCRKIPVLYACIFALGFQDRMCGGSLDSIIDSIDPNISKWASLVIAHDNEGQTEFD